MRQVVQIIRRCEFGTCTSRPFQVKADDEKMYFFKGPGDWMRKDYCYETLCARMALAYGLPVAPFDMLEVSQDILMFSVVPDVKALSPGIGFGSQKVGASSLLPVTVQHVPQELRWKILLFDWWIQNEDRILGEMGGNVNLLWNAEGKQLVVIDHNNAFDLTFNDEAFFAGHVFGSERNRIEPAFLLAEIQKMGTMITCFSEWTGDFPDEWLEQTGTSGDFQIEYVLSVLDRYKAIPDVFGGNNHD